MLNCHFPVSVLVPVYNVERYLERCVRSLFEQTYDNLRYVFVDDCSSDGSIELLKQVIEDYPDRKPAVSIVKHENNRGLAVARNTALDHASGEFIYFVDSDDWLEPDAIELLVKKQGEKGYDLVSGNYLIHYYDKDVLLQGKRYQNKEEMVRQMMQRTWDHYLVGRLIRLSLLVDNDLRWNEGLNIAEDLYMMTMIAYYAKSFAQADNHVYHYERRNNGSITVTSSGKKNLDGFKQELGNMLILEEFFKDKTGIYQDECARCIMELLNFSLNTALKYSARDDFHEIVKLIDGRSEEDRKLIGWETSCIKGLMSHQYALAMLDRRRKKSIKYIKRLFTTAK